MRSTSRRGYGEPSPFEEGRQEAEDETKHAEQRAMAAEAKAASSVFPRLRLQVNKVTEGHHVYCSEFQSNNGGTNWACTGRLVYDYDWFRGVFGEPREHRRIEFEITGIHAVEVAAGSAD